MKIKNFDLDRKVLIIAEIGNNHEGNIKNALELIRQAAACGVDAVKFQTFRTDLFVSPGDEARYKRLKSFELSFAQFEELSQLARSLGLIFISTPLDLESAAFLEKIIDAYKIASPDLTFFPLLKQVARTGKPVILSTGMSEMEEVKKGVHAIRQIWNESGIRGDLGILHCVTSYPVASADAHLKSILHLKEQLDGTMGYSDHTLGTDACFLSIALGARIIEKHFTLDKKFSDFRDHTISADPTEMKELVRKVRLASELLGTHEKVIRECERGALKVARRSIVASSSLKSGHRIAEKDLLWIRPAGGLPPGEEHRLLGKKLKRNISVAEPLSDADVE